MLLTGKVAGKKRDGGAEYFPKTYIHNIIKNYRVRLRAY